LRLQFCENLLAKIKEDANWNGQHLTDVILKKWCLMKFPLL
jgi:hypothetical protein